MNKIYKVVWSKAKHAYVVTSEVAKSHTKSASGKAVKAALAAAVGMGVLMGGWIHGECGGYNDRFRQRRGIWHGQ